MGAPARADFVNLLREAKDEHAHKIDDSPADVDHVDIEALVHSMHLDEDQAHVLRNSPLALSAAKKGGKPIPTPRRAGPSAPRSAAQLQPYYQHGALQHPMQDGPGTRTTAPDMDRKAQLKSLLKKRVPPPLSSFRSPLSSVPCAGAVKSPACP